MIRIDQCRFGRPYRKATCFYTNLPMITTICDIPRGHIHYVTVGRSWTDQDPCNSKDTAIYPQSLNRYIAECFLVTPSAPKFPILSTFLSHCTGTPLYDDSVLLANMVSTQTYQSDDILDNDNDDDREEAQDSEDDDTSYDTAQLFLPFRVNSRDGVTNTRTISDHQLTNIHVNNFHRQADDLHQALLAMNIQISKNRLRRLIAEGCQTCRRLTRLPRRPKWAFHSALQLNDIVSVDIIWFKSLEIQLLFIIDHATRWLAAHTVDVDHSSVEILALMHETWHFGLPSIRVLVVDAESSFSSKYFVDKLNEYHTVVAATASDAHFDHGLLERHVGIFKQILRRLVSDDLFDFMSTAAIVQAAVGCHNVRIPSAGVSAYTAVTGNMPRLPEIDTADPHIRTMMLSESDQTFNLRRQQRLREIALDRIVDEHLQSVPSTSSKPQHSPPLQLDEEVYYKVSKRTDNPWLHTATIVGFDQRMRRVLLIDAWQESHQPTHQPSSS
jgi:hypothetical protein